MICRIGLDIDDTICDFINPYLSRFGTPKEDSDISRNVYRILRKDRDFWLNLPIINYPNFNPTLYCTKRIHNKEWTRRFLEINNLSKAPIYQVYYQFASKAPMIKGKVDVFIDDSISNFIDLNLQGIPCLLIDSQRNKEWGPVARIYSLDREEIEDCYQLFIKTIFPYFKEFVDGRY